jgi:hypothetical protein
VAAVKGIGLVHLDLEAEGWVKLSDGFWAEPWDLFSGEHKALVTSWAWDRWAIASCVERNGGHAWWLNWDEFDGLWLHCRHCPAGVDELYPDGNDSMYGELPVPGYAPLRIDAGEVTPDPALLGEAFDEGTETDMCMVGWGGPVRAWVETESHYSYEYGGTEYDVWLFVEAA